LKKVRLVILKPWISQRINAILKMEDEVVTSMVFNILEDATKEVSLYARLVSGGFFVYVLVALTD